MPNFSNEAVVWVGVPVPRHVLQHFIQFADPAAEMARVLSEVLNGLASAKAEPHQESVHLQSGEDEDQVAAVSGPSTNPFEQIRAALADVNKRAEGYGSIRLAAEIAYRHFGSSWLDADPSSPGNVIREQLRAVLWDALSDSHSNKSVPWRRFQDFAADYGKDF